MFIEQSHLLRNDEDSHDLENLLEESSMPLQDLLARYNAPVLSEDASEDEGKDVRDPVQTIHS